MIKFKIEKKKIKIHEDKAPIHDLQWGSHGSHLEVVVLRKNPSLQIHYPVGVTSS